ncbi:uncharacterized protein BJ171DRAFT_507856 [Polychytrium aggregatum]|uniref:uncharacterized protein n=1 Tax=Polychytrium aggregatum TaxID=110093 RepID=UPI0022FF3EFB|nr:uncharacterized protein BJ171DRAFT_507856 [Polychytrium aggregatum]KAI9203756.1 hypothetical protein BJ171DRAFT_507856 [Polychytrium aggregatum]
MRSLTILCLLGATQTAYGIGIDLSQIYKNGFRVFAADANPTSSAVSPVTTSAAPAPASTGRPALQLPPPMPKKWPSVDQTNFITGDLLKDPLVQDALAYVQSVVPASLLSIAPSTYVSGSTVKYTADANANCYWPSNLCVRAAAGNGYQADVYTCPQPGTWGISFDDGPTVDPVTHDDSAAIRAQLDKMNIKGTFFVVGSNVIQNPQIVLDEYNDGHQIGVHTWTHHPLTSCTNEQIVAELKYAEAIVYNATGQIPYFFRPPYGDIDDRVRAIANALGYSVTIWDKDDLAADQTTTSVSVANKLINTATSTWFTNYTAGFISLSHDIDPFTSGVILSILQYVDANRATIKLNIEPVGTCVNKPWFRPLKNATATTTTSASASSTAAASASSSPSPTNGSNLVSGSASTFKGLGLQLVSAAAALAFGVAMNF